MFNPFSWLLAGPEAATRVLDAGVRGIDALVYTDEEKAVAKQKLLDGWLQLQKDMGEETTVRAVTRRILAILIIVPFVFLVLSAAVAYFFDPQYTQFLIDLADGQFGIMALAVTCFYFGPYMIGQMLKTNNQSKPQES